MKVYIDTLETKQYFFEAKDEDGKIVSLYRDENRYIYAEINGEIYKSKIKLSNKKWHTVGLTFLYKFNTGSSMDGSLNQVYRCNHIIYDDTIEQFPTYITELKNLTISIGRLITSLNSTREEGDLLNYQPLFGQIEMFCFTKNIVDVNTLKEVNNELNKISTKTNYYDDMGMLVNTTYSKNNNEYINKEYIYLDNSNKIKKESINLLNQTYEKSYTYDALGRIKTVVDTMFTNKVYSYDYRGFLIQGNMDIKITDGMKKEGKICKYITIFAMILFLLSFLDAYVNNKSYNDKTVMSMLVIYGMFLIFGLYGWLYTSKYKIVISNTNVKLKTLFRKEDISLCDVKQYTYKKYKKSKFWQFILYTNNKKILINTRYKEEFEEILKQNKIKRI